MCTKQSSRVGFKRGKLKDSDENPFVEIEVYSIEDCVGTATEGVVDLEAIKLAGKSLRWLFLWVSGVGN